MFDEAPPPVPPRQSTFDDGDVSPVHRFKKKWWFIFLNKKEKRQHVREACFLQLTDACDIRPQVLNSSFDSTSTIQQDYHLFMNLFNTTLIFSTNPLLIEFEDSMHFVRLMNQDVLSEAIRRKATVLIWGPTMEFLLKNPIFKCSAICFIYMTKLWCHFHWLVTAMFNLIEIILQILIL